MCKGEFSNPNQEYFSRRAQNKKESKKKKKLCYWKMKASYKNVYYIDKGIFKKEYIESSVVCFPKDFCNQSSTRVSMGFG